ncbi:MAG: Flp pilus assembly complex ATPase component TadA [Planctomycetes bacterium]|nr:Flp pilus assembly complex ATPase component TadA [Planctomycetota bacterium]
MYTPQKPLGQLLKEMELVTEGQIQEALAIQREKGGALGRILVDLGYVTEEEMLLALGAQVGMEVVNLDEVDVQRDVVSKVSPTMAKVYKIIPIKFENNCLTVAMADPLNVSVLDDLRFMLNCDVQGAVSNEDAVNKALERYYAGQTETVDDILKEMTDAAAATAGAPMTTGGGASGDGKKIFDIASLETMANQAPVIKLLNLILLQAIKDQASDIHFEPFETEFKVRYRVDGVLYEMMPPPLHLAIALISRIKVMSNLDISEVRLPQDGRIMLAIGGKPVDLRVSTLPTMFGESVVMRILDRSVVSLDIDNVGLREEDMGLVKRLIDLPNGIILVTGPTGSGKTTTLYSCLNYVNDIQWKIITTEDPVEYDLEGIIQCQINEEAGLTYAACLRAILRQDPDILLVGEIRDLETAEIAIEASLTGHMVFTTLHTNDAPSTITRLIDLGVETFLIAATLEAVIAQRLVRKICLKCKEQYEPPEEVLMEVELTQDDIQGKNFCEGRGCPACNNTGYKGRLALFEIMLCTTKIRELVMENASTDKLRMVAREQGMRTLRESGLLAIFDGITTIEEVVRETLAIT